MNNKRSKKNLLVQVGFYLAVGERGLLFLVPLLLYYWLWLWL